MHTRRLSGYALGVKNLESVFQASSAVVNHIGTLVVGEIGLVLVEGVDFRFALNKKEPSEVVGCRDHRKGCC